MAPLGRKSRTARRRVDRDAFVVTDNGFALKACKVVDMSDEGAQLKVEAAERLPKHFTLTFSRATRAGRRCEMRWRRGSQVGVKFVS